MEAVRFAPSRLTFVFQGRRNTELCGRRLSRRTSRRYGGIRNDLVLIGALKFCFLTSARTHCNSSVTYISGIYFVVHVTLQAGILHMMFVPRPDQMRLISGSVMVGIIYIFGGINTWLLSAPCAAGIALQQQRDSVPCSYRTGETSIGQPVGVAKEHVA